MASPQDTSSGKSRLSPPVRAWLAAGVALISVVVSSILLIYLLHSMDWVLLRGIAPLYLVLILLLSVLGTALYTVVVYILVGTSGHHTTFVQAYLVLTASLSANYVTPVKLGIPLRVYLYNQFMSIPTAIGTALVTLETLVGMLVPALIAIVGIASLFTNIGLSIPLTLLAVLLTGTVVILLITPERAGPLLSRLPFRGCTERVVHFIGRVQVGLRSMPAWASVSVGVLFSLNLVVVATQSYLVLHVLGYSVSLLALLYTITISVTAGNLSLIPMGLGVRDASFTLLLMQLGIPLEVALLGAGFQRLLTPGWPLLLGLISANVLGIGQLIGRSGVLPASDAEHFTWSDD